MSADPNTELSPHFKLWEFTASQTAERKGIDNTPTDVVVENLRTLCQEILEPARVAIGPLRISSGYRSPALNQSVGGSKTSAHVLGYAADVIPLSTTKLAFAKWVEANSTFDQIILEFGTTAEPAWIHVSCDPRARRQVLRILAGTGYVPITL
ncbi:MAG TPA: D-Ala-D-Ala carboxypeptidase family metallohydrolase [Blastocatellia bacterium]|nr:D-Ala-D-Ala carboxypeptidase family metallohydrolase [Blastocatellia bacterium]